MRKKFLICICVGLLALTACGNEEESRREDENRREEEDWITDESIRENAGAVVEFIERLVEQHNTEPAMNDSVASEASTEAVWLNTAEVDYSCYYYHIDQVARGIELGFPDDYVMDLEAEFAVCIRYPEKGIQYGYLLRDLNDDGIDELIFGANGPEGIDGTIYDIYTIRDGRIVSTFIAWDRERYYLCKNGAIAYESDGGAGSFSYSYYNYEGQVLLDDLAVGLRERVIYDGFTDGNNPWFYSEAGVVDFDAATPITEDQANAIIASYEYEKLKFTPFE